MTAVTTSAAQIAEERLALASQVQSIRDAALTASDEDRTEKAAELQSAIEKFENCDRQYQFAAALENANRTIEALSKQPQRPVAKAFDPSKIVNTHTGQPIQKEWGDREEALASPDYDQAFKSLIVARGRVDRVNSRHHLDMLERYGKGNEPGLASNEVFLPFNKAMTLASTTNGSNLVAPDFRFDVITQRSVTPKAFQLCNVINSTVTSVTFPKNTDTNTDSGRVGIIGTNNRPLKGESPTPSASDTGPFSQLTITAKTGTMSQIASADFWADAPGFSRYLQTESNKLFANRIDKEVFSPTQISESCESIFANTSVATKTSGTSASLGANDSTIFNNLSDLFFAFEESYSSNISWVMNRATHGKLIKVKDTAGLPLLYSTMAGGPANAPRTDMFGSPVTYCAYAPASGAAGAKSILVGDFSEYILLVRQGFTVLIDEVTLADANAIKVVYKYRIGGAVRDPRAFIYLTESI